MDVFAMFATFFQGGGPFMFVILGIGVVITAIALERLWVIGRASLLNAKKLREDVIFNVKQGNAPAAAAICEKVNAPVSQIALAILTAPNDRNAMLDAAEGEAAVALPPLTRRLPHLSMLANVATLLGLLGTIFGLTTAFAAVGAADPSQRSAFLAAGISQALNTTAFGLIVAVPTLLLHAFYVAKVERIVEQADEMSHRLIQVLANTAGGESAGQAASHTSGRAQAPAHEPQAARAQSENSRVVLR